MNELQAAAACAILSAAALLAGNVFQNTHPSWRAHCAQTGGVKACVPEAWPAPESYEINGEASLDIKNHPAGATGEALDLDEPARYMVIHSADHYGSTEKIVAASGGGKPGSSEVSETRLAPSRITAFTWTAKDAYRPEVWRYYVWRGPNGGLYYADYLVPDGWEARLRYENIWRRILGTIEYGQRPSSQ